MTQKTLNLDESIILLKKISNKLNDICICDFEEKKFQDLKNFSHGIFRVDEEMKLTLIQISNFLKNSCLMIKNCSDKVEETLSEDILVQIKEIYSQNIDFLDIIAKFKNIQHEYIHILYDNYFETAFIISELQNILVADEKLKSLHEN